MSERSTMEYLGTEPRVRRVPWLGGAVLAVVALLVLAGFWWTQRIDREATEALAASYAASLEAAHAGENQVQVAVAYVAPALWRPDLPAETEDALWQVVQDQADAAADRVAAVRGRIDAITVLPWRSDQRRVQEALAALVTQQEDRFRAMADDARRVPAYLARGPVPTADAAQALQSIDAPIR